MSPRDWIKYKIRIDSKLQQSWKKLINIFGIKKPILFNLPDSFNVGIMFPEARFCLITDRFWDWLGVWWDLTHSLQVGILFSHFHAGLSVSPALLPLAMFVFKWAPNGSCIRILLSNLKYPFCSPHGHVLADPTLNGSFIWTWGNCT